MNPQRLLLEESERLDEESRIARSLYARLAITERDMLSVTESTTKRKIQIAEALARLGCGTRAP